MKLPRIILKNELDQVHGYAVNVESFIEQELSDYNAEVEERSHALGLIPLQTKELHDLKVSQNSEFNEVKAALENRLLLKLDDEARTATQAEMQAAQTALDTNLANIDIKLEELSSEKQRLETTTVPVPNLNPEDYEVHPNDLGLMVKLLTDAGRLQAQTKIQKAHGFGSNPREAIVFALSMIGKVANIVELIFVVLLAMIKAQEAAFKQTGATDGLAVMNAYGMITLADKIAASGVTTQFVSNTDDADAIISEYVAAAITTKTALASAPRNVVSQERSLLQPQATVLVFDEVPHKELLEKNGITTLDKIPNTLKDLKRLKGFNADEAKAVFDFVKADAK